MGLVLRMPPSSRDPGALTTDDAQQLFNASAVMESRMSTRLGENIKLLTLVSIFFLPLSFCTVRLRSSLSHVHLAMAGRPSLITD